MTAAHDTIANTAISSFVGVVNLIFEPTLATAVMLPITLWLLGQTFVFIRWWIDRRDRTRPRTQPKSADGN